MSKNRDFLKEAIADAKAVKESAIANAKAALEESFTPRLKSMLAQKIEELDTVKEDDEDVYEAKDKVNEKLSDPVMRKGLKGDNEAELEAIGYYQIEVESAETAEELLSIRTQLARKGWISDKKKFKKRREANTFRRYTSPEGFQMVCVMRGPAPLLPPPPPPLPPPLKS